MHGYQNKGGMNDRGWVWADFSLFHSVQTALIYPLGTGGLCTRGAERQEREADHSAPPSEEVQNVGAIPSLPHALMA
jgi:hypothetical protein